MAATPEETLADEARRHTKAGATAIAAGILTLAGSLVTISAGRSFPTVNVIEALRQNLGTPPAPGTGVLARQVEYYNDHLVMVLAVQLVPAIASTLSGVALVYLYLATRARSPQVSKIPLIAAVAGAVMVILPALVAAVALTIEVRSFGGAAQQTEQAARDVLQSTVVAAAYFLVQLGRLVIGVAFIVTALNAMKVGLLTRFMGVLGIIVGALFLFPLGGELPFVTVFWLLALGALFLGRWPGPRPPAWVTGEAHPWPTQQEIREQRMALRAERSSSSGDVTDAPRRPRRGRAEPPETPAPEPPRGKPHPSSKKKKRKRR